MHFTRTTPRNLHFQLLNVNPNEGVKLTVWHSRPNRLDVFVQGEYVISTNARIDDNGRYIITMPTGNTYPSFYINIITSLFVIFDIYTVFNAFYLFLLIMIKSISMYSVV